MEGRIQQWGAWFSLLIAKLLDFLQSWFWPIYEAIWSSAALGGEESFWERSVGLKSQRSAQGDVQLVFPDQFDLPTGVALGGCAFGAYLDPEREDYWKMNDSRGTCTTYIDREILLQNYAGYVEVTLKGAKGLPKGDILRKSDPYVIISIGESFGKTKVCHQTLEPEWNETLHLSVRDPAKDVLKVWVKDYDCLSSDDELGTAVYSVNTLMDQGTVDLDLELQGTGGDGTLFLSAKYIPFTGNILATESMATSEGMSLEEACEANALPRSWTELAVRAGKKGDERFDPVCYVENRGTDSQAWIHCSGEKEQKEVVIAFRGTEQTKWKDILTDVNFWPSTFDVERSEKLQRVTESLFCDPNHNLFVHSGFLKGYNSIKQSIFAVLGDMIGDGKGWRVYVTGHSLGGALATLCSFELASRVSFLGEVQMYNYGSPRVGNWDFAKAFRKMVPVSWRIANHKDIVITVPELLGYTHVHNLMLFDRHGVPGFSVDPGDDDTDADCSQLEHSKQHDKELGHEHHSKKFLGIMGGLGVADHLEDQYYSSMKRCVSLKFRSTYK